MNPCWRNTIGPYTDSRFDELSRGGWTDDYTAQVAQAFAEPHKPAGEWESAAAALQRFLTGIDALLNAHAEETIALVGRPHLLPIYLLGQPTVHLSDWQNLPFAAVALAAPEARRLLSDFQPVRL
ncbi:MAG: hypothetical protein R2911_32855 [Caldilineaceae bacterium]